MASELKVDKFTGVTTAGSIDVTGEGNSTTTNLQQGLAKAWTNTQQASSYSTRDSFNLASITDGGTGKTGLTFTNAFANANYVMVSSSGGQNSTSNGAVYQYDQATAKTTSAARVLLINTSGGIVDTPQVAVAFFGD